eukprot:1138842-Pelagomonas_calceolata.AAC.5
MHTWIPSPWRHAPAVACTPVHGGIIVRAHAGGHQGRRPHHACRSHGRHIGLQVIVLQAKRGNWLAPYI